MKCAYFLNFPVLTYTKTINKYFYSILMQFKKNKREKQSKLEANNNYVNDKTVLSCTVLIFKCSLILFCCI